MVKIKGLGASLLIGLFLCGCGQAKASSDATSSDSKTATPQPSSSSSVITLHEVFEDYNKAVLWETDVPYGSDIVYAGKAPTTSYDENGVTYTWTGSLYHLSISRQLSKISLCLMLKKNFNSLKL